MLMHLGVMHFLSSIEIHLLKVTEKYSPNTNVEMAMVTYHLYQRSFVPK